MRKALPKDFDDIVSFLSADIGNCVYIYIDILKYGLGTDSPIDVWFDGFPTHAVIMKYHDSFQMYGTILDSEKAEISKLLLKYKPRMLYGEKSIIQEAQKLLQTDYSCDMTYGAVYEFLSYRKCSFDEIEPLSVSDMREVAGLMRMDAGFGLNYTVDDLEKQLVERIETKMGRNYGIRKDGKLVGHIATFAEFNGIAVTSGLIVHPNYRNKPYGAVLENFLISVLLQENFKIYTFVHDPLRIKLLKAMKQNCIGEYAKLVVKS